MTKHNSLQNKLAHSLDKANKKGGKQTLTPSTPDKLAPAERKKSVALQETDLKRIDAILDYMKAQGYRLNLSKAIQLALRTCPLSPELTKALAAIRAEDGRGKW